MKYFNKSIMLFNSIRPSCLLRVFHAPWRTQHIALLSPYSHNSQKRAFALGIAFRLQEWAYVVDRFIRHKESGRALEKRESCRVRYGASQAPKTNSARPDSPTRPAHRGGAWRFFFHSPPLPPPLPCPRPKWVERNGSLCRE